MEMGGCVRIIKGKEVRRDDPVKYFLPAGVGSTSWVPKGVMAIEVLPEWRDFWRREEWREKRSPFYNPSEKSKYQGAYPLRNETEENLLKEMLTLTLSE